MFKTKILINFSHAFMCLFFAVFFFRNYISKSQGIKYSKSFLTKNTSHDMIGLKAQISENMTPFNLKIKTKTKQYKAMTKAINSNKIQIKFKYSS